MTHSIRLIIGRDDSFNAFLRRWDGARVCELKQEWFAIPVDDALFDAIAAAYPSEASLAQFAFAPPGLVRALEEATRNGGSLAYVETDYFGGSGDQAAVAATNGRATTRPARARMGPINDALRAIGVERRGELDAFDTIDLGRRRTMDDYASAPVEGGEKRQSLRGAGDRSAALPLWIVGLAIVAAIAGGVFIAMN